VRFRAHILLPVVVLLAAARLCCGAAPEHLPKPVAEATVHAEELIGVCGRTQWLGVLTEAAKSQDATTRARAAFVIGQICAAAEQDEPDECEAALRALAQDGDRAVRIHAGIALGHLGVEAATPTCAAALADGPRWRRYYAVVALTMIGTPRARRLLVGGLEAQSEYIRDAAEWFLLPVADRPPYPGRKAEHTPAPAGPAPPAGTPPEQVFADAANVLWPMAEWHWHSGKHEDCIRLGLTSTFLDPSHVDAWGGVAWLTWSAGRDAEAIQIYLDGLNATPYQYDMYFELGFHLYNTHRYRAALPYLQQAAELPAPFFVRHAYAHCLQRVDQLEKCLEVWVKLVEQDPENDVAVRNHARVKRLVEARR